MSEDETLRWPTRLDHAAIITRLIKVREAAYAAGLSDLASRLVDIESMSSAKIGAAVLAVLTSVQGKSEHRAIAKELEMVALNLKNLDFRKSS